jgi:hypothetical protein
VASPGPLGFPRECNLCPSGGCIREFRIEPTSQGCRLTWTLAHDPKNPPLLAKLIAKRVMNVRYRQYRGKLRSYTDMRFGVTI